MAPKSTALFNAFHRLTSFFYFLWFFAGWYQRDDNLPWCGLRLFGTIRTIRFLGHRFPPASNPGLRIYISKSTPFVLPAMTSRAQRDQIIGFIRPQLAAMYEMMDVQIF